jgi:hypothetical protein
MFTAVATTGFTAIVIPLLVAEEAVTQVNEVVIVQVTTSELFRVDVAKVLPVPEDEPFTNH